MLAKHIALTLFVGCGLAYVCWSNTPAHWTPLRLVGLCLAAIGFTLWFHNPVYYFGALTIAGLIVAFSRPVWLLIFVFVIPLQIWRIGKERRVLEAAFGEEYRAYRAKTWF